jgi:hypothetical protein
MNSSRPSLAELISFATGAAHKSFRQAADELRVSPSTLSHTVRALETRLGVLADGAGNVREAGYPSRSRGDSKLLVDDDPVPVDVDALDPAISAVFENHYTGVIEFSSVSWGRFAAGGINKRAGPGAGHAFD